MKALVVYANRYRMLAPPPLGAMLVADRLRRDGHGVCLLDLMFARSPEAALARAAVEFGPNLIAFSLRNHDTQSRSDFIEFLPFYRALADVARRAAPRALHLLGGSAFTTFPCRYLGELAADYGLAGDDLDQVSRFVASLAAGRPDLETPGLVYRQGGEVLTNPFQIAGYAQTPFQGWDLLDLQPYRRALWTFCEAGIVVRTGCPFHCIYCDTFRTFGRQWVLRDPRQVASEMVTLRRRHGVRSVFFADAGFNRPLDHAKAVLEEIVRARPGIGISAIFEPGEVDEEFVRLYRRAGGRDLMVFAASLADPVLAAQRKPFRTSEVLSGARLLHRGGVLLSLALNLGGPGETPETIDETLRLARTIPSAYVWLDKGYRVQPDTELRALAVAEGVIAPEDDCFRPTFYFSTATPEALVDQKSRAFRRSRSDLNRETLRWTGPYVSDKLAAWLRLP